MIKNYDELVSYASTYKRSLDKQRKKVLVCAGTGCVAGGSLVFSQVFHGIVSGE